MRSLPPTHLPTPATINGRWDAVLTRNGTEIPFRLDIKGSGADLEGVFYDGFKPYDGTTSASFKDGKLVLNIEHYLTTINATLEDGKLSGTVAAQNREVSAAYGFRAVRHVDTTAAATDAPAVAGTWVIPLEVAVFQGRKGIPSCRAAAGRGGGGLDPAHRWRHRLVQRRLQGRQMGAEPL